MNPCGTEWAIPQDVGTWSAAPILIAASSGSIRCQTPPPCPRATRPTTRIPRLALSLDCVVFTFALATAISAGVSVIQRQKVPRGFEESANSWRYCPTDASEWMPWRCGCHGSREKNCLKSVVATATGLSCSKTWDGKLLGSNLTPRQPDWQETGGLRCAPKAFRPGYFQQNLSTPFC